MDSRPDIIREEYAKWLKSRDICNMVARRYGNDKKTVSSFMKTMEAWYHIQDSTDIPQTYDDLLKLLSKSFKEIAPYVVASLKSPLKLARVNFKIGDYKGAKVFNFKDGKLYICSKRYESLLLNPGVGNKEIATLLLRYKSRFAECRQYCLPTQVYQKFVEDGYDIEGMSSAFNYQMRLINPNMKFCSMYPDVEADFGSVGNFFKYDFEFQSCVAHLPRIQEVFTHAMKYMVEQLEKSQCRFAVVVYYEEDYEIATKEFGKYFVSRRTEEVNSEDPYHSTILERVAKIYIIEASSRTE